MTATDGFGRRGFARLDALLVGAWLLTLCAGALAQDANNRQITVEQMPMLSIRPPASTLGVDVWTNRSDNTYRVGDDITLYVRTSYDASVTVLNVDATGRTTMLFPNAYATDNRLHGNQVYQLPGANASFKLRVGGPAGVNLIKVIATTGDARLLQGRTSERSGAFETYTDSGEELARQIEAVMARPGHAVWAAANRPIRVVTHPIPVPPPQILQVPAPAGYGEGAAPVAIPAPLPDPAGASNMPPATLPFGLSGVPSAFGLELRPTKASYRVGEELSLTVTSERNCKLTLLSIDGQDNATVLYPNRLESEPSLRAGRTSFLPRTDGKIKLTLMGASGPQRLVALCGEEWSLVGALGSLFGYTDRAVYPTVSSEAEITQAIASQLRSGHNLAHTTVTFLVTP